MHRGQVAIVDFVAAAKNAGIVAQPNRTIHSARLNSLRCTHLFRRRLGPRNLSKNAQNRPESWLGISIAQSPGIIMRSPNALDDGYGRLQTILLEMRVGDTLDVGDAVRLSGLSEEVCRSALEALAHIGLMTRSADDRFVRLALRRAGS
jgi:hypothetical protein